MKQILLSFMTVALAYSAQARDFKIVGQEFMPIQGTGPDGKMGGVYVEVMKEVCSKLKWNCKFEGMPLARCLEQMTTGDAQMTLGIAKNPEREAIANFPGLVTQVGYTFFVKKGTAAKFTKVEDFKGYTVGAHVGSATGKDLIEQNKKVNGEIKIADETTAETPGKKLAGDRYGDKGAAYIARAVGMYQAKNDKLDIEPVAFDAFLQSHSMPMAKKGVSPEEFELVKKTIHEVMKTDKIKKLVADAGLIIHADQR